VIVGRNQGVSLRFISSLQLQKSMHKGCKLYVILALNEKGVAEGLEHLTSGERVCKCIFGGVTWDAAREGIGVYHRPKIGD
jgi:hypothetical protein